MEEKQLNLNQPFLSVRRISSTASKDDKKTTNISRPPYKSELKSGPVSNPGVVPFLWEHSPGRPKDETSSHTDTADRPPIVPKLPPGRTLKAEQQSSNKAPESQSIAKGEMESLPREPQPSSRKVNKLRSFGSSNDDTVEEEERFESADEDETYVDALDTLSRTESFFLNCSISGISGMDESHERERYLSRTVPEDPGTRDFMIDRFLPAAKAMASEMTCEVPQYALRKQPAVQEQPRQLKKAVKVDMRPQLRYGPSFARHYYQSHDYAGEGSGDDNGDEDDEYLPTKVCGLLPCFGLKSSLFLMNPVPGMSVRTRVPMSPNSRIQTRSSSAGSCSGTENERSTSNVSEKLSVYGVLTAEPHEDKNDLEDEFKKKTCHKINDHKLDGSSPYREEDSDNPAVEKTLYIDTVHKVESSVLVPCCPETKESSELIKEDRKILTKKREQKLLEDFPFIKGTKIKPIVQENIDLKPLFSADKLNSEDRWKPRKANGKAQFFNSDRNTSVKIDCEVDKNSIKKETRSEKLENKFHVPPPLPQSPSESWLCRTLPSLPTKNSSSRPYHGNGNSKNQTFKAPSGDPKWETMVKTTKGHHHHLRYSEELMTLAPIPETQ